MSQDVRQDVYRAAMNAARVELNEILGQVEQLRLQKDRVEKVMEALKPMLRGDELVAVSAQQAAPSASNPEQQATGSSTDPVQPEVAKSQYQFLKVAEAMSAQIAPSPDPWSKVFQRPATSTHGF